MVKAAFGRTLLVASMVAVALAPRIAAADWPTYHLDLSRTGYDPGDPAAGSIVPAWNRAVDGEVYAEPLLAGSDLLIATENNSIYALDVATGTELWPHVNLGTPVPRANLPCGNIDPVGITSTPAIDRAGGVLYAVAQTWTAGQSATIHYELYAIDLNNRGAVLKHETIAPPAGPGLPAFNPSVQGQRGALAWNAGTLYIPFGGRAGDCGNYRGWVVGVNTTVAWPAAQSAFELPSASRGGGFLQPAGEALGASGHIFVTSGYTLFVRPCSFDMSESVIRLTPALAVADYFAPSNWSALNNFDVDLGSVGPALIAGALVFQVGKEAVCYLRRQSSLGGANHQTPAYSARVCTQSQDAAFGGTAYAPPYIYVPCADRLEAITVRSGTSPSFQAAWHGPAVSYSGPPIVAAGLVWTIDPAGALYGLDPSTGAVTVSAGIGRADHFATPTAGNGRLFLGAGSTVRAYTVPPSPWHAWETLDGTLTSGPDAASWGSGRIDVVARGAGNELIHKWYDGLSWHTWESLGGQLHSDPAATSWSAGRLDVFGRGFDDTLQHRWYDAGGWHPWESLGGALASGPDVTAWGAGRLDVMARGAGGDLIHTWYDGTAWHPFESLGGSLNSDPSVVSRTPGRLDVFARGSDYTLQHMWYDGTGWHPWESLGGNWNSGPDAASWGAGRFDVFIRGNDGALWHEYYDATGWHGPESLAGSSTSDPGAVSWGTGRIDAFIRGGDGTLWHRWFPSS